MDREESDLARRAKALYNEQLRADLEATHRGEFCSIEPDSGDWFLGASMIDAINAAKAAHPDRLFFSLRSGIPILLPSIRFPR
jgi:hypothetical protein